VIGVVVVIGLEAVATIASQRLTPFPWSVVLAAVLGWSIRMIATRKRNRRLQPSERSTGG